MDNITVALCMSNHDINLTVLKNGKLLNTLQENRFSRIKYDKGNYLSFLKSLLVFPKIDDFIFFNADNYTKQYVDSFLEKNKIKIGTFTDADQLDHHLFHACSSFYKSDFSKAGCLSIDGWGGIKDLEDNQMLFRTCSIFKASVLEGFEEKYSRWLYHPTLFPSSFIKSSEINDIDSSLDIGLVYDSATKYLGFHLLETGKTMGLSSYGNPNNNLPKFFKNKRGDRSIFNTQLEYGGYIDSIAHPEFILFDKKSWHKDSSKANSLVKDMAYNMQLESQEIIGDLVEEAIQKTKQKNICITGGYGLNCVTNYYMVKRFPNINFYHDPLSSDAGTSIGAALYGWYKHTKSSTIHPIKTLYNGPKYSQEELLEGIKKYV